MDLFNTARLCLRNLSETDADFLISLRTDADCARFQRWEDNSPEHIRKMIDEHRADALLSDKEIRRFIICLADGAPIGTLVLFVTPSDGCITLGITVAPAYQRRGYAKELLLALTHTLRAHFPTLDLIALIHPDNTPSVRLFEGLGFAFDLYAESIHSLVYILRASDPCQT